MEHSGRRQSSGDREPQRGHVDDATGLLMEGRALSYLEAQRMERLRKEGERRRHIAEPCHGSQLTETQGTVRWRASRARPDASSLLHSPLKTMWGGRACFVF